MESQKTFDYSIFKTITSHREIDQRHVNRLVKAITTKNLLHINPIICNESYEVIDGQHRLEAAKIIGGIYIYYVIDSKVSKEDIAAITTNSKNWSIIDYVNYYAIEKKPNFDKLSAFLSEYPEIPASTSLIMLSAFGRKDLPGLKNGQVDVSNYQHAQKIAAILKGFRNIFDWTYDRNFIMAVMHINKIKGYDHEIMKSKLEFQSRSLVRCINKKQYIELLEEIYNYKSSKSRLKFS